MGQLQTMLSCLCVTVRAGKGNCVYQKATGELHGKPHPVCTFKWVELLILVPTANPSFPQESKPQDKKKHFGALSYSVPTLPFFFFFLSFFFFFFFLFSLEPSEKHQGTEVSTLSYYRSLVLSANDNSSLDCSISN